MRMIVIARGDSNRSKAMRRSATYAAPVPNADWASAMKKSRARRSALRRSVASRMSRLRLARSTRTASERSRGRSRGLCL